MPTAKNRFQILYLHPKKHVLKKNMVLNKNIKKTEKSPFWEFLSFKVI